MIRITEFQNHKMMDIRIYLFLRIHAERQNILLRDIHMLACVGERERERERGKIDRFDLKQNFKSDFNQYKPTK